MTRPLDLRLADARQLHDRLVILDGTDVWDVSQSLEDLATRSPATLAKSEPDIAAMKVAGYAALFDTAEIVAIG